MFRSNLAETSDINGAVGVEFAMWCVIFQASDLQRDGVPGRGTWRWEGAWLWDAGAPYAMPRQRGCRSGWGAGDGSLVVRGSPFTCGLDRVKLLAC
jgi:hypothetical protein